MDSSKLPPAFIEMQFNSIAVFNLRFSHHIMKIDENLHSFVTIMEDSRDDIDFVTVQREKRIRAEFVKRFTRDYLYPIQLKINKLESEYLSFISKEHCKIAQSMILRPLVLTLLKKISSSTQVYLQFLRKNNAKVYVKLKEILNFICHSIEIIKVIVDHRILKNNDIEKLCALISNHANDQKQEVLHPAVHQVQDERLFNNSNVKKNNVVKKSILKKITHRKVVESHAELKLENKTENFYNSKNEEHCNNYYCCRSTNTSYTSMKHSTPSKVIKSNDNNAKSNCCNDPIFLRNSISEVCSKMSDGILNELVIDVTADITECIKKMAFDAFNLEFCNNY